MAVPRQQVLSSPYPAYPDVFHTGTLSNPTTTNLLHTFKPSGSPYPTQPTMATTLDGAASEVGERRCVKSVILNEEFLGPAPEESVRYVEVPYIEEVVRQVPRKEVIEVEKRVPKFEYEWIDRVVEVPHVQYVDKTIEVPQIHEVIKHVPRREVVEIPREVIRHVPKIETKIVDKFVEIPGEVIEVPKPYSVENKVAVPHYVDQEVPLLVAQTLKPVLSESNDFVDVEVVEYQPEVIPVDIHVPKAVQSQILSMGVVDEQHRLVQVPSSQYNSMLRMLNPHIAENDSAALPYVQNSSGAVSFLGPNEHLVNSHPIKGVQISGWEPQSHTTAATIVKGKHRNSSVSQKHRYLQGKYGGVGYRSVTPESVHTSCASWRSGYSKSHHSMRDRCGTTATIASSVKGGNGKSKKVLGSCSPC